jgi:hypothetical protein
MNCCGQEATFNVVELQAKWVAKVLSGKILLPTEEEMMESVKEFYQFMEENGFPKRHTHSLRPFQVCKFLFFFQRFFLLISNATNNHFTTFMS